MTFYRAHRVAVYTVTDNRCPKGHHSGGHKRRAKQTRRRGMLAAARFNSRMPDRASDLCNRVHRADGEVCTVCRLSLVRCLQDTDLPIIRVLRTRGVVETLYRAHRVAVYTVTDNRCPKGHHPGGCGREADKENAATRDARRRAD